MNKILRSLRHACAFVACALFPSYLLVTAINTAPVKPTTAFDATKIARLVKAFAVFTPTGGAAVTIVGKVVDLDGKTTVIDRKIPDSAGINRADSHFATEAEESVTLTDIEEIDTILTLIGGLTGLPRGSVQFFLIDPRDAANTVRYLSDAFACAVQRDGTIKGDNAVSKNPTLKFLSEKSGAITWTPAGATS